MDRVRIVWARIWAVLGPHFQRVALGPCTERAMVAVDALRQLAVRLVAPIPVGVLGRACGDPGG